MLGQVPRVVNKNVLVGFDTADDAGVYKLTPDCALVQTVDFFTPIVDDPYTFGAITAANSLSDIYAMGGQPLTALSIVAFPAASELEILTDIIRGGANKIHEAGCVVIGGHSITDEDIKFGYAITGTVHPDRVISNRGACAGDVLMFTKRIGTGIISTAIKKGYAKESDVQASVKSMLELNRSSCEAMLEFEVHACTDVTGFGLIGHAREMALASNVTLEIEADRVQYLPGAIEYSKRGAIPGGLKNNRVFASCAVEIPRELPEEIMNLLYDPQTSGGLLIALSQKDAASLEKRLNTAYRIGSVITKQHKAIRIK